MASIYPWSSSFPRLWRGWGVAGLVAGLGGCGGETAKEPAAAVDSGACAAAPTLTWANFGHGFLVEYCQPCHASAAPDRHGAPAAVVFDSEADAAAWAGRIAAVALVDPPTMPPEGGVLAEDLTRLELWLSCAPPTP